MPPADRCHLLGPIGSPPLSMGLPRWTPDVPGFCIVCGWLPPGSPEGASASLAFLARFLAAPHRFLLVAWRPRVPTFSIRPSRFSELGLVGVECSPHVRGVSPDPCSAGSYPVAPICGASRWEPLSESPGAELSTYFKFSTVFSIWIPRVMGKCPPGSNPIPSKAEITPGRSPGIPGCAVRVTHCHSSHRHGTHTVGLGIFFKVYTFRSAVFCATGSPLVGYGPSPCTDGHECREAICRIYHPWGIAEAP